MKKFLIFLFSLVVIVALSFDSLMGLALSKFSDWAIEKLQDRSRQKGIFIERAEYNYVDYQFPNKIIWENVVLSAKAAKDKKNYIKASEGSLYIESVELRVGDLFFNQLNLEIYSALLEVVPVAEDEDDKNQKSMITVNEAYLTAPPLEMGGDVKGIYKEWIRGILSFLKEGYSTIPLSARGYLFMEYKGKEFETEFYIKEVEDLNHIVMPPQQVMRMATELNQVITPTEAEVFSHYPLRVPKLFNIKRKSKVQAAKGHMEYEDISEDAFTHIFGGYYLTKTYDANFAEYVTTAHEIGSTRSDHLDQQIDITNNKIGIEYAKAGFPESKLFELIAKDPDVARSRKYAKEDMKLEGFLVEKEDLPS